MCGICAISDARHEGSRGAHPGGPARRCGAAVLSQAFPGTICW